MKIREISEGVHAAVVNTADFNPDNVEVMIRGVGVYTLAQMKNRLKNRLAYFSEQIETNPEMVESILTGKSMDAFISMLKGYNEVLQDLDTPQMKRKRTLALKKAQYSTESVHAVLKHIKECVPFCDSVFRYQSDAYFETLDLARHLYRAGLMETLDWESVELLESEIGTKVKLKNLGEVYLDTPYMENLEEAPGDIRKFLLGAAMLAALWNVSDYQAKQAYANSPQLQQLVTHLQTAKQQGDQRMIDQLETRIENHKTRLSLGKGDVMGSDNKPIRVVYDKDSVTSEAKYQGKTVELNKPKRGGSKKFYVYVKNPKTKKIKKVSFGAKSGGGNLAVKLKDPKARKAFADRHNCAQKNDKTKAGYWACRLPRYAKSLGLSGGGTWW